MVGPHHEILEHDDESALRGADGEKQVDHADDAEIVAQDENAAAVGLLQNQPQPADLFGLVGMKVRLPGKKIRQQLRQKRHVLEGRRFDAEVGHGLF